MRMIMSTITGMSLLFTGQLFAADALQGPVAAGNGPVIAKAKVLVVYYSRSGHTKTVAEDIARALGADVEQLVDRKDRSGARGYLIAGKDATQEKPAEIEPVKNDPAQYDIVVIGTPVWAWNMTPAVRTYIADHKAVFKELAFFTSAGATKPVKIVARMEALAGRKAKASAGFFDNDHQEKNRSLYREKLDAFVAAVK